MTWQSGPTAPSDAGMPVRQIRGRPPSRPGSGMQPPRRLPSMGWANGTGGWQRASEALEGRLTEEGGHEHHGMDRRAHIVVETGHGQILGPASTTGPLGALHDRHRQPGTGQRHRGRQSVGSRPHHHHIHRIHGRVPSVPRTLIQEVLPPEVPGAHIGCAGAHIGCARNGHRRWPDHPDEHGFLRLGRPGGPARKRDSLLGVVAGRKESPGQSLRIREPG